MSVSSQHSTDALSQLLHELASEESECLNELLDASNCNAGATAATVSELSSDADIFAVTHSSQSSGSVVFHRWKRLPGLTTLGQLNPLADAAQYSTVLMPCCRLTNAARNILDGMASRRGQKADSAASGESGIRSGHAAPILDASITNNFGGSSSSSSHNSPVEIYHTPPETGSFDRQKLSQQSQQAAGLSSVDDTMPEAKRRRTQDDSSKAEDQESAANQLLQWLLAHPIRAGQEAIEADKALVELCRAAKYDMDADIDFVARLN